MEEQYIKELLERYERGECTPEEVTLLESLHLRKFMHSGAAVKDEVKHEIWSNINPKAISQKSSSVLKPVLSLKYAAIAAALLICVGIGYFYFSVLRHPKIGTEQQVLVIDDVSPGGNIAFLTLGDGSRITLDSTSKGILTKQAGITVSKNDQDEVVYNASSSYPPNNPENPIFNSITTPKGGQFQVVLPDGSKVWLNAASSIKFPISFASLKKRQIELTGEAYFEIAKNEKQPFTVSTPTQTVEVLGTHFNINSYLDESAVKTTLLEGSIRIFSTTLNLSKTLKPGQTASHQNERILIQPADETAVAWKNGMLEFKKADLKSILRQVARWYDLKIEYQGLVTNEKFTGGISRKSSLSALLEILRLSNVNFEIEELNGNRTLVVKP